MRVALVCDWFLPRLGGIEVQLRDLAHALLAQGDDPVIITTTPGANIEGDVPVRRIASRRLPIVHVPCSPPALSALAAELETGYDVVHSHVSLFSPFAYAGALVAARRRLPAAITFHSQLHASAAVLGAANAMGGLTRRIALSAVSSVVARQAARWLPGEDMAVLPNGIDVNFWRAAPRRTHGTNEVVIVSAMRLTRKKRPMSLLRAFHSATQFTAGSPRLRLIVAGDGPDLTSLRRKAAELGIAAQVEFPGRLSRESLRDIYAGADLFVLPSELESFGLAALEARAAGLPVVAMLGGGARDFITTGQNGLLIGDAAEMSQAIAQLSLDSARREYMRVRNEAIPPAFDWVDIARQHREFYEVARRARITPSRASQP